MPNDLLVQHGFSVWEREGGTAFWGRTLGAFYITASDPDIGGLPNQRVRLNVHHATPETMIDPVVMTVEMRLDDPYNPFGRQVALLVRSFEE
jgi:hypothetical protein